MSARFFVHLGFLLLALLITYIWTKNATLSLYTVQALAFLVLLYFSNHYLGKRGSYSTSTDSLIFTLVTLLLVSQTGGLSSPLFFLLYILLFGLSLFSGSLLTLIFSLVLILFFSNQIQTMNNLIQLISLSLMTPLALFFGKQYLQLLEKEEKIEVLEHEEKELTQEVTQQEEDTLLWLTLAFREEVARILDASSNMLADISRLTVHQKEGLEKIHQSAKHLFKLGQRLREKIEG